MASLGTNPVLSVLVLVASLILAGAYVGLPKDRWQTALAFMLLGTTAATVSISQMAQIATPLRVIGYSLLLYAAFTLKAKKKQTSVSSRSSAIGKVRIALWLFLGVAVSSAIISEDLVETVIQLVALSVMLLCFLSKGIVERWQSSDMLLDDLAFCYKVLSLFAVIGTVYLTAGGQDVFVNDRYRGIYNNANMAALLCIILVPIALACWRKIGMARISISLPAIVLTVLLSGSRTALITVLASFVLWLVIGSAGRALIGLMLATCLASLILVFESVRGDRASNLANNTIARLLRGQQGDETFLSSREMIWAEALRAYSEKPLTGYGYGNAPAISGFAVPDIDDSARGIVGNSFIQLLVEVGPVGLGLVVIALMLLLYSAVRLLRKKHIQFVAVAALCGVLAQATESALFGLGQSFPWVLWIALIGSAVQYDQERRAEVSEAVS